MATKEYLSCADTAKLVRAALKAKFPRLRFGVRSKTYSGGASIDVDWVDGPTSRMVDDVIQPFAGGGFDGMIDLKYSVSHWMLPDGSVAPAYCSGTEGSRGVVPGFDHAKPHPDAKMVHFGADFIFPSRRYSERFIRHACAKLTRDGYPQFATVEIEPPTTYGGAWIKDDRRSVNDGALDLGTMLHRLCSRLVVVDVGVCHGS